MWKTIRKERVVDIAKKYGVTPVTIYYNTRKEGAVCV